MPRQSHPGLVTEMWQRVQANFTLDLGFFSFVWFDALSEQRKWFVTRLRQKSADKLIRVLSQGQYYRDEISELGQ